MNGVWLPCALLIGSSISPVAGQGPGMPAAGQTATVSVTEFGATGGEDDTSAFSKAINQAAETGRCVFVPPPAKNPPVYTIDTITLPAGQNVCIEGGGAGSVRLRHRNGSVRAMLTSGANTLAGFTLRDISIDGNAAQHPDRHSAVIDIRADQWQIENIELYGSVKAGIRIRGTTYRGLLQNCWLHDFALHDGITGHDTTAVLISKETASDGTIWVLNNRIEMTAPPVGAGNSVAGIVVNPDLDKNQRMIVSGNYFHWMGQDVPNTHQPISPIECYKNCSESIVRDNVVRDSYSTPIQWQRSSNYKIVDNILDGEADIGPSAWAAIHSLNRAPVLPIRDVEIAGNTIENFPHLHAVFVNYDRGGEASDVRVEGNTIYNCGGGVAARYVLGTFTFSHNSLVGLGRSDITYDGLYVDKLSYDQPLRITVDHNSFTAVSRHAILIDAGSPGTTDVDISHNWIGTAGSTAVILRHVATASISDNTWAADSTAGLEATDNGVVRLSGNFAGNRAWVVQHNDHLIQGQNK